MKEPARFREATSDAPEELRSLFRSAKPPSLPSEATHAALSERVATIAATRTLPLVKVAPWLLGAAALMGSAIALRGSSPPQRVIPPRPVPSLSPPSTLAPQLVETASSASAELALPQETEPARPRSPSAIPVPKPSAALADPLSAEAQLLSAAHRALATDPNKALAVAREHARRYPQGQLAAERELIVVQALMKLGRTREAEARGQELKKTAPKSIYGDRLDKVLGGP